VLLVDANSSLCSRSFASFSSTFFRAESVSTGFAAPKGFDFDLPSSVCGVIGLGSSGCSLRGKSVNFLRCIAGDPPNEGEEGVGVSTNVRNHRFLLLTSIGTRYGYRRSRGSPFTGVRRALARWRTVLGVSKTGTTRTGAIPSS